MEEQWGSEIGEDKEEAARQNKSKQDKTKTDLEDDKYSQTAANSVK